MDAGNTLGAIVFLAAGTWLGWKVVQGRAQNFLAAMAGGGSGSGSGSDSSTGANSSAPPASIHGPLAGVTPGAPPSSFPPAPTVFSDVFGQNGGLSGPNYDGPFGPYSPNEGGAYDPLIFSPPSNIAPQVFSGVFHP
jgi:hypothetical protein